MLYIEIDFFRVNSHCVGSVPVLLGMEVREMSYSGAYFYTYVIESMEKQREESGLETFSECI